MRNRQGLPCLWTLSAGWGSRAHNSVRPEVLALVGSQSSLKQEAASRLYVGGDPEEQKGGNWQRDRWRGRPRLCPPGPRTVLRTVLLGMEPLGRLPVDPTLRLRLVSWGLSSALCYVYMLPAAFCGLEMAEQRCQCSASGRVPALRQRTVHHNHIESRWYSSHAWLPRSLGERYRCPCLPLASPSASQGAPTPTGIPGGSLMAPHC